MKDKGHLTIDPLRALAAGGGEGGLNQIKKIKAAFAGASTAGLLAPGMNNPWAEDNCS